MTTPIDNHKTVCAQLAPLGWRYVDFDDDFYLFQTGDYASGFKLMQCLEEDLSPANLALMAQLGVTRIKRVKNNRGLTKCKTKPKP